MPESFFTLTIESISRNLNTDVNKGLSNHDATSRLQQHGANNLPDSRSASVLKIFLGQFSDFMIVILIGAAVISGFIGESEDTLAIITIVLLNAILGFVQEYRAEKALKALRAMTVTKASVLRDGYWQQIDAEVIVPGDIISLEAGGLVPADLRLTETHQLQINESVLTGESNPVEKDTTVITDNQTIVADQRNMAFKGTVTMAGRGIGIVTATGQQTELGRIASLLTEPVTPKSPLQIRLSQFGKQIAIVVLILCGLIFAAGVAKGEDHLKMFLTALSLAVAAIPEALPAVITVLLSLGARRMSRHNALIRRLPAVETLGSVTYICSDKTGTLTENKMRVVAFGIGGEIIKNLATKISDHHRSLIGKLLALSNDTVTGPSGEIAGEPTETALCEAAANMGFHKIALSSEYPRVCELAFSSERMMMTTVHQTADGFLVFSKGSPEVILAKCQFEEGSELGMDVLRPILLDHISSMASQGFRVLGLACKKLSGHNLESGLHGIENDLTLLGFVGLIDPPRSEVFEAIRECHNASIKVVMITGDHPATAVNIGKQLGLFDPESHEPNQILTGKQLTDLSDEQFVQQITNIRIYARVSPDQKIRIVQALQASGEFVAMTGDGVNDAPALKAANIGVSMGKNGSDVAREASHMVLLDDNFATIVSAIREGRRIYDNIRKFIRYALTGNSGEIWTLMLAPILGLPIPLLPIHILWVNLVTDGLPGLSLASEPCEPGIMMRPPRRPNESVFAHGLWQHVLGVGLLIGLVSLTAQYFMLHTNPKSASTAVFTVLTMSQLFHVLAIRSEHQSLFKMGFLTNKPLLITVLLTASLQAMAIYMPFMNHYLKTSPLAADELVICIGLSAIILLVVEIEKLLRRRHVLS